MTEFDQITYQPQNQTLSERLDGALVESLRPVEDRTAGQDLWRPHPDNIPQNDAYQTLADETYFGGAAGGGKTDLEIGLAITAHQRSIIFRRHYTDLTEIEERLREILGQTGARYNANDHIWRNVPGGRRIELGAVQHEDDKEKWKGRPHDLKAFDEVSDFSESQYLYLSGWNRSADPDQRCRVVAAGNPPTSTEGAWVIDRFRPWLDPDHPKPARPGELRWFVRMDDEDTEVEPEFDDDGRPLPIEHNGEQLIPRSRTFIPALLEDNPYYGDEYRAVLQQLPEPLKSQLLYGDFTASLQDDPWQAIPTAWIQAAFDRWDEQPKPETGLTAIGCDPSRGGRDPATIQKRFANWYAPILEFKGEEVDDGPKLAAKIIEVMAERDVPVQIDPIGVGSSPHDSLLANGVTSIPVNFSAAAKDRNGQPLTDRSGRYKFRNVRAAAIWKLREALDPEHGDDLMIPRDSKLRQELAAHRWKLTVSGIQIHSKDEVKAIIGRSPNRSDALVLASYVEALVGSWDDIDEEDMSIEDFEGRWA